MLAQNKELVQILFLCHFPSAFYNLDDKALYHTIILIKRFEKSKLDFSRKNKEFYQ